ncbi:hypothetical protein Tco_1488819 [Tanacetum coccineum]
MSLANLKATTEYQEAIQATEDLESPVVDSTTGMDRIRSNASVTSRPRPMQELESEWENPFTAKRDENHTILHLSKE